MDDLLSPDSWRGSGHLSPGRFGDPGEHETLTTVVRVTRSAYFHNACLPAGTADHRHAVTDYEPKRYLPIR